MLNPASSITVGDSTKATNPAVICLSGRAVPPSVMSAGRLRACKRDTSSAEMPNVAALTPKTRAGGLNTSSRPAMAGPTITDRFSTADCALLAAARNSSPTIDGVAARAAGSYDDPATDVSADSTIATITAPCNAATTASAHWSTRATPSSVTISRTRSVRSASRPPNGLVTKALRKRVIDAAATHAGECVASKTNTTSATLYAQDPLIEMARPQNSSR